MKVTPHVDAANRVDHRIEVRWIHEGLDPLRPGAAIELADGTVKRTHGDPQKPGQAPMRGVQLVRSQHQSTFRWNRRRAGVDVPGPGVQVSGNGRDSAFRQGAIVWAVRIPVGPEPPAEERDGVAGDEMARDRLEPRAGLRQERHHFLGEPDQLAYASALSVPSVRCLSVCRVCRSIPVAASMTGHSTPARRRSSMVSTRPLRCPSWRPSSRPA